MNRPVLNLSDKETDSQEFRISLKLILNEYFDETELRDLCFTLEIDFQNLIGKNKLEKIQELIQYIERRDLMPPFVQLICQRRPNACQ